MAAQQPRCGHGFLGDDVTRTGEHDVWLIAIIAAAPLPGPSSSGTMCERGVHAQPLKLRLLINDDEVKIVMTPEAVICYREQAIGVRWEVNPHYVCLFTDQVIDKPRPLVAETIMVVAPTRGCQQIVE